MKHWNKLWMMLAALVLCAGTLFSPSALAAAGPDAGTAEPLASNFALYEASLSQSSAGYKASATIRGSSTVTKCQMTLTVQKSVLFFFWSDESSYTYSSASNSLSASRQLTLEGGNTYRIKVVATVSTASSSESKTFYSDSVAVPST